MLQVLALSDVSDFLGFVWDILQDLLEKITELVNFIKNIIIFIPKIFSFLPNEIMAIMIPTLTIVVFAAIYKFIR